MPCVQKLNTLYHCVYSSALSFAEHSRASPPTKLTLWWEHCTARKGRFFKTLTSTPFAECALVVLVLVYGLLYIKIQNGWWFEDDPGQYLIAMHQSSPFSFFCTRELVRGVGNAVTPFLLASMWLDAWLAPRSVTWAYMHQLVVLVLTTVLVFELTAQVFKNKALAFVFAATWIMLPSTQAVFQFISARHYLEGMLVSATSLLLLFKGLEEQNSPRRIVYLTCACALLYLCMLFKEIYAAAAPLAFFIICLRKHQYWLSGVSVACAIVYAIYRSWAVGSSVNYIDYGMPLVSFHQWLKTVSHFPYMLTANYGGYVALLLALSAAGYSLYTRRASIFAVACFAGFIVVTACSLYPIAFALNYFWQAPGTYYRTLLLLNSVLWLFCVWAFFKLPRMAAALILLCLAFPLALGSNAMCNFWTAQKARYEQEGKIYLSENKLIYSQLPAWWYLNDVARLYNVRNLHYIAAHRPDKTKDASLLEKYKTIWRVREGRLSVANQRLLLHGDSTF